MLLKNISVISFFSYSVASRLIIYSLKKNTHTHTVGIYYRFRTLLGYGDTKIQESPPFSGVLYLMEKETCIIYNNR